jgi:hypothetical protein
VFEPATPRAWLRAFGGAGGGNTVNNGGRGSGGRIRVDVPADPSSVIGTAEVDGAAGAVPGTIAAGPTWDTTSSRISTSRTIMLGLWARTGSYGVLVDDVMTPTQALVSNPAQATPVSIDLSTPGLHTVCVLFRDFDGASPFLAVAEAKTCVDVVYVPQ